jgi:pentose-5-phosphate-3-epimerase
MIKLKELITEGYTSQSFIKNNTPKIQKLIAKLQKDYPDAKINLVDNYKWLGRNDLKGTYTLSVDTNSTDIKKLKKDIDIIYKLSN